MSNYQERVQALIEDYWPEPDGSTAQGSLAERGRRLLEESLELAQALGVPRRDAARLLVHVFGRDPGEPSKELGQVVLCTASVAYLLGEDERVAGEIELERLSQPGMKEIMQERLRIKQERGLSS